MSGESATFGPPYWSAGELTQVNGFPRYPAEEMQRRHDWLQGLRAELELGAVVVAGTTAPLDTAVQFFTNWPPQVTSYLLAPGSAPSELLVRLWNHLPDARRIAVTDTVSYGGDTPQEQAETVAARIQRAGWRRVGLIGSIPHDDYETIRSCLPSVELIHLNPRYRRFRLVKSEAEMVYTRIASRMNDAAVAALAAQLRPGLKEYQVAGIIEDVYLEHRGVNLIHFSLSTPMGNPQVCVPHQYHPDRTLEQGDVFVTEISTTFWGYAGQILRTFTIGGTPLPALPVSTRWRWRPTPPSKASCVRGPRWVRCSTPPSSSPARGSTSGTTSSTASAVRTFPRSSAPADRGEPPTPMSSPTRPEPWWWFNPTSSMATPESKLATRCGCGRTGSR